MQRDTMAERAQREAPAEETALEQAVLPWIIVGLVAALSIATFLAIGSFYDQLSAFDTSGLTWAYQRRGPVPTAIFATVTWWGDVVGMTIQGLLFLGLILWRRPADWRWWVLLVVLVLPLGFLVSSLLKVGYERARPSLFDSPYVLSSYAYPSGHAFASIGFYGALAYMVFRKLRHRRLQTLAVLAALLLTVVVSFTRVYFSVHYPTDVIGGAIGGLGWLILCIALVETVSSRVRRRALLRQELAQKSPPS